jgi:hypothetical protein
MATMIWNAIVDHIPLWGWIVIFGVPTLAALYFAYPILLPIWNMLPTPVKVVVGGAFAGLLAYLGGRYKGRKDEEDAEKRRDAEAIAKRNEIDVQVDKLPPGEATKKLRDGWSVD